MGANRHRPIIFSSSSHVGEGARRVDEGSQWWYSRRSLAKKRELLSSGLPQVEVGSVKEVSTPGTDGRAHDKPEFGDHPRQADSDASTPGRWVQFQIAVCSNNSTPAVGRPILLLEPARSRSEQHRRHHGDQCRQERDRLHYGTRSSSLQIIVAVAHCHARKSHRSGSPPVRSAEFRKGFDRDLDLRQVILGISPQDHARSLMVDFAGRHRDLEVLRRGHIRGSYYRIFAVDRTVPREATSRIEYRATPAQKSRGPACRSGSACTPRTPHRHRGIPHRSGAGKACRRCAGRGRLPIRPNASPHSAYRPFMRMPAIRTVPTVFSSIWNDDCAMICLACFFLVQELIQRTHDLPVAANPRLQGGLLAFHHLAEVGVIPRALQDLADFLQRQVQAPQVGDDSSASRSSSGRSSDSQSPG